MVQGPMTLEQRQVLDTAIAVGAHDPRIYTCADCSEGQHSHPCDCECHDLARDAWEEKQVALTEAVERLVSALTFPSPEEDDEP